MAVVILDGQKKRALAQQLRRADVLLGTPLCHLCIKSVVILVFCDRMWWCMCEYLTSVCAVFEIHASLGMDGGDITS